MEVLHSLFYCTSLIAHFFLTCFWIVPLNLHTSQAIICTNWVLFQGILLRFLNSPDDFRFCPTLPSHLLFPSRCKSVVRSAGLSSLANTTVKFQPTSPINAFFSFFRPHQHYTHVHDAERWIPSYTHYKKLFSLLKPELFNFSYSVFLSVLQEYILHFFVEDAPRVPRKVCVDAQLVVSLLRTVKKLSRSQA